MKTPPSDEKFPLAAVWFQLTAPCRNDHEMKTCTRIREASLALMLIALLGMGPACTASPEAQPAEPEQLRGLPVPNELPLAQGPFQGTQASLDEHYRCPKWFADAKLGFWAHWGPQSVGSGSTAPDKMYAPSSGDYQRHLKQFGHPSSLASKTFCHSSRRRSLIPMP